MKRILVTIISCLLLVVSGCGESNTANDNPNQKVLSTVCHADEYGKYIDMVNDSSLPDEDKIAFKSMIQGGNPKNIENKTIKEIIEIYKEDEVTRKEEKAQELARKSINSNIVINKSYKCTFAKQNAPIEANGYNMYVDYDIVNNSDKILQAIKYELTLYDDFGDEVTTFAEDTTKLNIQPGQSSNYWMASDVRFDSSKAEKIKSISTTNLKVSAKVKKAVYTDGTIESSDEK